MKALVFDLDDTLYNEADFVHGAFREVADYLSKKHKLDRDELYRTMLGLLANNGRGRIFNDICALYNLNEDISSLVEIYRNSAPQISLYEDAEHFLKYCRGKFKLGLVTDGIHYVQWNKIRLLDLEKFFDSIIVTDDYGKDFCKPSIKPYVKIAEELGVDFDEIICIGDNPRKDFYGAKQLGIHTVRIIRPVGDHMRLRLGRDYEADREITGMYEMKAVISWLRV
ncbi:MAG: HAD family hydrolase [Gracilibacteraceae bacterium]|nr:HAD family hydrolase [Gracilibacteraceae bacterium]